jgi:hypothetical protein
MVRPKWRAVLLSLSVPSPDGAKRPTMRVFAAWCVSAAIPPGLCLNVSQHCPNDIDYLCDKTDLNRRWCTCWGGVTECVTLGACKYTPCKTCQVCLSWAAQHTPQLFNLTNTGIVAAEVNTRCKAWGKPSLQCQTAADQVAQSEVGNSGKRGGKLCSLLQECVNPEGRFLAKPGSSV